MQTNIPEAHSPEKRWALAASAGLHMPLLFQKLLGSGRFLSSRRAKAQQEQGHGRVTGR